MIHQHFIRLVYEACIRLFLVMWVGKQLSSLLGLKAEEKRLDDLF